MTYSGANDVVKSSPVQRGQQPVALSTSTVAKQRNEVSVKIDAEVYRMVRTIAAWKGVNISEYLSEIVRPIARRDMAKVNKEASKDDRQDSDE